MPATTAMGGLAGAEVHCGQGPSKAITQVGSDALENERAVGPAKTKVVFDRYVNLHVTRNIGAVIEIALGILIEKIGGRRRFLLIQR